MGERPVAASYLELIPKEGERVRVDLSHLLEVEQDVLGLADDAIIIRIDDLAQLLQSLQECLLSPELLSLRDVIELGKDFPHKDGSCSRRMRGK